MASYVFAGISGAIGSSTQKPHILLSTKLHNLLAARGCSAIPNRNKFSFDEKDLASEENLWNLYERWMSYHNVSRSLDEKHKHFNVFKQNAIYVHNFNKLSLNEKLGDHKLGDPFTTGCQLGLTEFADGLTPCCCYGEYGE